MLVVVSVCEEMAVFLHHTLRVFFFKVDLLLQWQNNVGTGDKLALVEFGGQLEAKGEELKSMSSLALNSIHWNYCKAVRGPALTQQTEYLPHPCCSHCMSVGATVQNSVWIYQLLSITVWATCNQRVSAQS